MLVFFIPYLMYNVSQLIKGNLMTCIITMIDVVLVNHINSSVFQQLFTYKD